MVRMGGNDGWVESADRELTVILCIQLNPKKNHAFEACVLIRYTKGCSGFLADSLRNLGKGTAFF